MEINCVEIEFICDILIFEDAFNVVKNQNDGKTD